MKRRNINGAKWPDYLTKNEKIIIEIKISEVKNTFKSLERIMIKLGKKMENLNLARREI